MQRIIGLSLCLVLVLCANASFAQTKMSVGQALDFWISVTEKEVMSAVKAMPEDKYTFAPSAGGEFAGVRTFGEQVKHFSSNN